MQPSAGPDLPHTRVRLAHWIATGVALAAVLGLSAVFQPPDASARPEGAGPAAAPDPAKARFSVDCPGKSADSARSGPAVDILDKGAADFDGDGRAETVALVRCHSGIGTPPSGIFVVAHPTEAGGRPQVVETLMPTGEDMSAQDFQVGPQGHGTVSARLLGYSSPEVPRCCPDQAREVKWEWRDGKFVLVPSPVAGSV
ncbi:hypothetical protein LHJ74_01950 [Streptomyces sp. N2-109]|uniref:Secreted protein n=1 Tax=Streptomyces gossypii TaxID=2883101 RepID=A0ABT2JLW5_9ACTN|nr:hypothetical protein [Streptomyces gossypii]MCT2588716.1 hypothetical protein [Streptomyces gossypii]